jgi:hypothetical protein
MQLLNHGTHFFLQVTANDRFNRFAVQLPIRADARATAVPPRSRIFPTGPLTRDVHRHLHPTERMLSAGDPLGLPNLQTAWFETAGSATTTTTTVSMEEGKGNEGKADKSVDWKAKSASERCIRVAVIDVMISAAGWSICVGEKYVKPEDSLH